MAYDRNEPNASYYSARYAERKRQAEQTRDAAAGPRTCNKCQNVTKIGSIFCDQHAAEYDALRQKRGVSIDLLSDFCQRTHWPAGTKEAPKVRGRITDPQAQYLRRLLNEAFANRMPGSTGLDAHHLERTSRAAASFAIERLKACKANGWKPLIENEEFWFWRGFKE
jgi:hypothetical protein